MTYDLMALCESRSYVGNPPLVIPTPILFLVLRFTLEATPSPTSRLLVFRAVSLQQLSSLNGALLIEQI